MPNPLEEKIIFPGVKEPLDRYWSDGTIILYYCIHCQNQPTAGDGETVVSVAHDDCSEIALNHATTRIGNLIADLQNKIKRL